MVKKVQKKPQRFAKKLFAFTGACVILAVLYFFSVPRQVTNEILGKQTSAYPAIDDFIKHNAFTSHVYRPKQPMAALPGSTTAQVIGKIYTDEPVVFLTIDDGVSDDPEAFYMLYKRGYVVTMFLNDNNVKSHYDFFKYYQQFGSTVQNHTISHPHLNSLNHDQQKQEICGNADLLQTEYGKRATLFRSPFGETNDSANKAVAECGMKANVWWSVVVQDGQIQYQDGNKQLRNGDIILLHFTPHLHSDLQAILDQIDKQHLQVGQLEDWLH